MTLVRILASQPPYDLLRQTPKRSGIWDDIKFTMDEVEECDYLISFSYPEKNIQVKCPPSHHWMIVREPPVSWAKHWSTSQQSAYRVFTTLPELDGTKYIHSQPALPWFVDRDYDFLTSCSIPQKTKKLSWVTSAVNVFPGHQTRLNFMKKIQREIKFDLFGRGFQYIDDKWNGLAPYHYSLAIENFSNSYFWSEKIADCFLGWTMPIYYGCTRITDYFPQEAMIQIDIHDPHVVEQIQEATAQEPRKQNVEAIAYARELVLNHYQFFPFVVHQIRQSKTVDGACPNKETIVAAGKPTNLRPWQRLTTRDLMKKRLGAARKQVARLLHRFVSVGLSQ
jgi:hypothetical protein